MIPYTRAELRQLLTERGLDPKVIGGTPSRPRILVRVSAPVLRVLAELGLKLNEDTGELS